jgi:DNA-binding LacI/PurR family transcriptional regulator
MSTITDVAKHSGVSIATVSNVLNDGPKPVRAETRQRVLMAARHLNYHPNAMAQGLVRRRMNTLGVFFGVVDSMVVMTNPYASAILQGVLTAATATRYNLIFFTSPWRCAEDSAAAFRDRRADGLLVIAPPTDSDILSGLALLGLTLVTVSAPSEQYGIPSVDVDNALGVRLATEHLLGLGHRRIAHLTGNTNMASVPARREAFQTAMADAGCAVPPEYIQACSYDAATSYAATQRLLSLPEPPTAIFAGNDAMAMTAMEAAQDRGLSVPHDLSIIGFDDVPTAPMTRPALTTIRQPLLEIGEQAARLLASRIEDQSTATSSLLLKPALVVRGSTGPVATHQRNLS